MINGSEFMREKFVNGPKKSKFLRCRETLTKLFLKLTLKYSESLAERIKSKKQMSDVSKPVKILIILFKLLDADRFYLHF